MRRRPETVVWAVMLASFAIFSSLCAGVVYAGYQYWLQAADAQWARLTVIQGSVALRQPGFAEPIVGQSGQVLGEGTTVQTGPLARAFVRLFDQSTLTLSPDTEVTLTALRTTRYRSHESVVAVAIARGKVVIGIAPPLINRVSFSVAVPAASAELQEGSYVVEVSGSATQLKVRPLGRATVHGAGTTATLGARQWIEIDGKGGLGQPKPLGQELVFNGDFREGFEGWQPGVRDMRAWFVDVIGSVNAVTEDGRPAAHFRRAGSRGTWSETFLYQSIGRDVSDLLSLRLSLDLKLVNQSLPGGGERGSEYPLMIRIDYRSAQGDTFWVRGFYYQNTTNNPTTNGVLVPQNQWVHYEEPLNLMSLEPRPREILAIQVLASGHDYESFVSRVSLLGE